ncbi:MAG TPA: putative PEP-binding protein [Streptomyces sp.]
MSADDAAFAPRTGAVHRGAAGTRGFAVAPVRHLSSPASRQSADGPYILVAPDLTPADTAELDLTQIAGFCTSGGGPTSHAVQVAYSLGIPTVVAAGDGVLAVPEGEVCALDGTTGTLFSGMGGDDLSVATACRDEIAARSRARAAASAGAFVPVTLTATVLDVAQARGVRAAGADGIGLLATEMLFLGRAGDLADEEQHYRAYQSVARAADGDAVTLRTLDIGGDKAVPALGLPHEDNSFLGVRGLRLSLRRPDLFRPQLRAAYRAARDDGARLRLMFPMVTHVEEFLHAARTAREIQAELDAPGLPLGVMVEVPACALAADLFAPHVDFLSIGTNDLAQYLLAASRTNPDLAHDLDPLHPALTRTVHAVAETGAAHKVPVGACGGVAGDPVGAVVLASLGVTSLTVALPHLPEVRDALSRADASCLRTVREYALAAAGRRDLHDLVTSLLGL